MSVYIGFYYGDTSNINHALTRVAVSAASGSSHNVTNTVVSTIMDTIRLLCSTRLPRGVEVKFRSPCASSFMGMDVLTELIASENWDNLFEHVAGGKLPVMYP